MLVKSIGSRDLLFRDILYLLSTAIGLMTGGNVYKDHTFNNETAHTCIVYTRLAQQDIPVSEDVQNEIKAEIRFTIKGMST
jgi:hypothetical protein